MRYILPALLALGSLQVTAQEDVIDSLHHLLRSEKKPAKRADIYSELAWAFYGVHNDSALVYARLMNREAIRTGDAKLEGNSYRFIGMSYERLSDYPNALKYQQEALDLFKKIKYKEGIANVYNNIGNIYQHLKEYEMALEFQQKALDLCYELKIKPGIAACLGNIGNIHNHLKNADTALVYYERSLGMDREMGNEAGAANSLSNIGKIHYERNDYKKARKYFMECYNIRKEQGMNEGVASVLNFLGNISWKEKDIEGAAAYYTQAVELANESSSVEILQAAYAGLYEVNKSRGNVAEALHYHELSSKLNDSIFNSSQTEEINKIKTSFALEQQEARLRALSEKKQREEERKQLRLKIINTAVIIGLVVIALFLWVVLGRYRHSQQQRKIIETQKMEVEEKNKQITDSIRYAKTIQQALMPTEAEFCRTLGEAFLFFAPRDIVSGDFYWMAPQQDENALCFAIADCTGHGVPGGFMSVLGSSALNEIVNERGITRPDEVLNQLRDRIRSAMGGHETEARAQDGMDISFFKFNKSNGILTYAGANSHIYLVRNGEIITFQGDKMPIGYFLVNNNFVAQEIKLEKGDMVYAFSDGYADQFGGQAGKKFMYRKLMAILREIAGFDASHQRNELMKAFFDWKGAEEQVDDVCLLGFRYS